ncbi:MAG: helix-turn-helix domain-containing protein [Firmicutes bacterium]|nr:helix-turn-helix domain-containing protein [Bacillota bacterium]
MIKVPNSEIHVHLDCFNYSKYKEAPLIEIIHYEKETSHQILALSNEIIIIHKGSLTFSQGKIRKKTIAEGAIILLPINKSYTLEVTEDTTLVIFRLDIDLNFCDHFSFEMLHREKAEDLRNKKKQGEDLFYVLQANSIIADYAGILIRILEDGLYCGYLLELKVKGMLFLLRYYYPLQSLKSFFYQILTDDLDFSMFIMRHYKPTLTVEGLAKKTHYSLTGFEKRFKRVFKVSPSHWMRTQRAQAIYHELTCSTKSMAELSDEFGFSSPSHFNSFCRKVFNSTPGDIRKKA